MPGTLQDDLAQRLPLIQDAFAAVLETYCEPGAGITAICENLGIHRKLAWQVRGVAFGSDPFKTIRMMPSRAGIQTLAEALAIRAGGDALAARVRHAAATFEAIVNEHAEDRASLEMLAEASEGDDQSEVRWREQAFRGNSFIFGVQARVLVTVLALHPSSRRNGWFDLMQVRGLVGLTRVRPDIRWLVGQSVIMDDHAVARQPVREALDPAATAVMNGVPVLSEFSSTPAPRLARTPAPGGMMHDELLPAPVGQAGQQTIYMGEVIRDLGQAFATADDRVAHFGCAVRTPAQLLVYDHLVHRELFRGVERELCVFGELHSPATFDDSDLLSTRERLVRLGPGLSRARCAELPGHHDMLRTLLARLGWNADDFEHFRVRMPYPPLPSSVMIRHDLPEPRPGG
ncbi:MAG: hypothetical protein KF866_00685 [Phycisphaeraceae bacterium]|nr:hypothetical protein [Phycisphaeraceae bacterium]MCW5755139.1 hypothetical protein [Phycisphaeraceae bacterium]